MLMERLRGVLAAALHSAPEAEVECGFLTAGPGALAQALHADVERMGACEASTYKVRWRSSM